MIKKNCILDYGLGNILSLKNTLNYLGLNNFYYSEERNSKFDSLIIPGVGSFNQAINFLKEKNLVSIIDQAINDGKLVVGICLGMQILFKKGFENGKTKGLNYFDGDVIKIESKSKIKLPHIGWKKTNFLNKKLSRYSGQKFYYVHSYICNPASQENILANSNYKDIKFTAAITKKNIVGFQFHPEKSGEVGINLLKDVLESI